ncbi:MAG: acetoin utilization protein AcuC, partial [Rhodococcus sp. (in: high G+C Gram-positive bacteria)]
MSDQATRAAASIPNRPEDIVVWSADYLGYRWSDDHPMNPTRLDLTMALATDIGLLEGVELVEPSAAPDSELLRFHTSAYIEAVKQAPSQGPALR